MRLPVPFLLVLLASLDAAAGATIVLVGGKEIAARSVERKGDLYLVQLEAGPTLTLPVGLVEGVRLAAGEEAAPQPGSSVQIVLKNASVLTGVSLERKDALYELRLASGETLSLPTDLVREVRFSAGEPVPPERVNRAAPSRLEPAPDVEAAPGPPEERASEPSQPREPPPRPSTRSEQLGIFLRPAVFPQPPAQTWEPRDSYGPLTDVGAFNPTRWYGAAHDPAWTPISSWGASNPLPDFNTARWYRLTYDPAWGPRDGWNSTPRFPIAPAASE